MSKRIEAKITCPNCSNQFDFTLYRSIWGEYPENRELVMTNQINVATCPSCNHSTKLQFPFIYTNANQHFAVWWEPEFDAQIDSDSKGYAKMMGEGIERKARCDGQRDERPNARIYEASTRPK